MSSKGNQAINDWLRGKLGSLPAEPEPEPEQPEPAAAGGLDGGAQGAPPSPPLNDALNRALRTAADEARVRRLGGGEVW